MPTTLPQSNRAARLVDLGHAVKLLEQAEKMLDSACGDARVCELVEADPVFEPDLSGRLRAILERVECER